MANKGRCPLMFEWYGEKYWGAAHGLAGIMHVLMHMELKIDEIEDVKGTLRYMIKNRFPRGNYPASEEDRNRDVLVHWCHGAPGVALTLAKAAEVMLLWLSSLLKIDLFIYFISEKPWRCSLACLPWALCSSISFYYSLCSSLNGGLLVLTRILPKIFSPKKLKMWKQPGHWTFFPFLF